MWGEGHGRPVGPSYSGERLQGNEWSSQSNGFQSRGVVSSPWSRRISNRSSLFSASKFLFCCKRSVWSSSMPIIWLFSSMNTSRKARAPITLISRSIFPSHALNSGICDRSIPPSAGIAMWKLSGPPSPSVSSTLLLSAEGKRWGCPSRIPRMSSRSRRVIAILSYGDGPSALLSWRPSPLFGSLGLLCFWPIPTGTLAFGANHGPFLELGLEPVFWTFEAKQPVAPKQLDFAGF